MCICEPCLSSDREILSSSLIAPFCRSFYCSNFVLQLAFYLQGRLKEASVSQLLHVTTRTISRALAVSVSLHFLGRTTNFRFFHYRIISIFIAADCKLCGDPPLSMPCTLTYAIPHAYSLIEIRLACRSRVRHERVYQYMRESDPRTSMHATKHSSESIHVRLIL